MSKNTVGEIVKRSRILLLILLCSIPLRTWAKDLPVLNGNTNKACHYIADLANRGSKVFKAQDLVGQPTPVDLRNNGYLQRLAIVLQGSAGIPALSDEVNNSFNPPQEYQDAARFSNISVLRAGKRYWEVGWKETLHGVLLQAATDATAVCLFHSVYDLPRLTIVNTLEDSSREVYRDILMGHGSPPPIAGVNLEAIAWTNPPCICGLGAMSWRLDLMGAGKPIVLAEVSRMGDHSWPCQNEELALIENDNVTAVGLSKQETADSPAPIAPPSLPLATLLSQDGYCRGGTETPVIGRDGKAYIIVANTPAIPKIAANASDDINRIRVLVGARDGVFKVLAKLSWSMKNAVVPRPKPY